MIRIGINGVCGRMGRTVSLKILQQDDMAVTTAFDKGDSECIRADLGILCGIDEWKLYVQTLEMDMDYGIDMIVDFSSPAGLIHAAQYAYKHGLGLISGTTGLDESTMIMLKEYGQTIPVLYSSNMSRGINETLSIMKLLKQYMGPNSRDIEIIEYHHNRKKDSPSGTALSLAGVISNLTGRDIESQQAPEYPRNNAIRIHAVRAGSYSGVHKIIISDEAETIEISHTAHSREAFANGVIDAVRFLSNRKSGFYDMNDVLREHE